MDYSGLRHLGTVKVTIAHVGGMHEIRWWMDGTFMPLARFKRLDQAEQYHETFVRGVERLVALCSDAFGIPQ